ncbi:MAG TPA: hypothetical protein VG713_06390 [Pirellulales bacterium]|nr:hypothetical protein [Pirellulales bacterium]
MDGLFLTGDELAKRIRELSRSVRRNHWRLLTGKAGRLLCHAAGTLGLPTHAALVWCEDRISFASYELEEDVCNLQRLRERGTTLSFAVQLPGEDSYDGWLQMGDRYDDSSETQ